MLIFPVSERKETSSRKSDTVRNEISSRLVFRTAARSGVVAQLQHATKPFQRDKMKIFVLIWAKSIKFHTRTPIFLEEFIVHPAQLIRNKEIIISRLGFNFFVFEFLGRRTSDDSLIRSLGGFIHARFLSGVLRKNQGVFRCFYLTNRVHSFQRLWENF